MFQLHPNGWEFEQGHVAKLELIPSDNPFGRSSPGQQAVTVSNLDLRLPVAEGPGSASGFVEEAQEPVFPEGTEPAPGFDSQAPETAVSLTRKGKDVEAEFFSTEENSTFGCKRQQKDWKACESPKLFKSHIHSRPEVEGQGD